MFRLQPHFFVTKGQRKRFFLDSVIFVVTVKGQLVDSFGRHCIQATSQQQGFFVNSPPPVSSVPVFTTIYLFLCICSVSSESRNVLWKIPPGNKYDYLNSRSFFSFFGNYICEMHKSLSERFLEVINAIISSGVRFCKFELQQVESSRESQIK